jgi:hypothetical protein
MTPGEANSNSTELALALHRALVDAVARGENCGALDFSSTPNAEGSRFAPPQRATLTRAVMEAEGRAGEIETVIAYWRDAGYAGLVALAPQLRALAEAVLAERRSAAATDDQPSRLIYQMY